MSLDYYHKLWNDRTKQQYAKEVKLQEEIKSKRDTRLALVNSKYDTAIEAHLNAIKALESKRTLETENITVRYGEKLQAVHKECQHARDVALEQYLQSRARILKEEGTSKE